MPKGWLKDLDLIQIKAAIWEGKSPLEISRQFLITQSTVSAIKHGRLHSEAAWPNSKIGPIPEERATELLRLRRMGMLRKSEMETGRAHLKNPAMRMPPEPVDTRTLEERWKNSVRISSPEYTEEQIHQGWLEHVKENEDVAQAQEQKRLAEEERVNQLRREAEESYVEETVEERQAWEKEQRRAYALSHLWRPRDGRLIVENLVAADLSDDEILDMVATDSRARKGKDQLEEFIEARRMAATTSDNATSD